MELWRRLLFLFRRGRFDRELDEEMQFHLAMKARRNRESGVADDEAEYAARRKFGSALLARERSRDAWGWGAVERLGEDVKFALRMLRKNPGFTFTATLVLALGIGANTAIFSAVNALVLNPFPFPNPDRLVSIEGLRKDGRHVTQIRDFLDWREQNVVFEEMATFGWYKTNLTGQTAPGFAGPERIVGGTASAGFLRVLGIRPLLGRFFTPEEDVPHGPHVIVLSYAAWQRRFGGRGDILGRKLIFAGTPYTVIGVLPARFALPGMFTCEFWSPAGYDPAVQRDMRMDGDNYIGRLRPGVPIARAQADLAVISRRLEQQYPATNAGWGVTVRPAAEEIIEGAGRPLTLLVAAVGAVLLIACANLAALLLARSIGRAKEIAIRASLGASRGRLIRQMLTESVLLSLPAGALGLVVARWGIRATQAAAPAYTGLDSALRIDEYVLGFALGASLLTGILFGLAPALFGSKADVNAVLKGVSAAGGVQRSRLLSALVVAEVSLALVLLIGGGLLMKSFVRLLGIDTGVRTEHLLTFQLGLPWTKYGSNERQVGFYRQLLERTRALPGVLAAGVVDDMPMSRQMSGGRFEFEGRPAVPQSAQPQAQFVRAMPGYFRTAGIRLLRGRDFEDRDRAGAPWVAVINRTLARKYLPNEDPVGVRIKGPAPITIVGVVADVRHGGPDREPLPQVYLPFDQMPSSLAFVLVRTADDPLQLAQAVRGEVHALDPDLPIDRMKSMEQVRADSMAEPKLMTSVLGGFSVFALALAAVGLYGVIAYSVSRRTHEIGVRMALGAARGDVLGLVVRRGLALAFVGVAIGTAGAFAASRLLASQLFGVSPRDLTVFTAVPLLLLVVAAAASYLPARRAARVNPIEALRYE